MDYWKSKEKKWSTLGWTFVPDSPWWMGSPKSASSPRACTFTRSPWSRSHFCQASLRKLKPLGDTPDLLDPKPKILITIGYVP